MADNTRDSIPGDDKDRIQERYDREFSGEEGGLRDVRDGEEHPSSGSQGSKGGDSKEGGFYKRHTEDAKDKASGVRDRFRKITGRGGKSEGAGAMPGGSSGLSKPLKYAAAGGIIGTLVLFLVVIAILFSLFGSLKVVHFATVLRSVGLARFTVQMQKQYTRTMVDAAAMTDNSTGSLSKALGDRSLSQKLRGVNPQKRAITLGEQDKLKFDFQKGTGWQRITSPNNFKGITLDGESITLDQYAQKSFGKNYDKLSARQRWTVESSFVNDVKINLGITDKLSFKGLWFRSEVYAIFRQAVGINMFKWANKAKEYAGKKPAEALKQDVDDTVKTVDQDAGSTASANEETNKEKDELRKTAVENAEKGVNNTELRARSAKVAGVAKDVSVAAFATTAVCIVHDLNNSFKEAGKQTQARAARLGHDALTTGDQIKQGDATGEAVGAEATRWGSAEKSALYKQQTGSPMSSADEVQLADIPNVNGPASTFASVIKISDQVFDGANPVFQIPYVGGKAKDLTCKVVLNQFVQFGIAGGELIVAAFSAGTAEAAFQGTKAGILAGLQVGTKGLGKLGATVGVGELLGYLIDKAVHSYAGLDYSATDNNEKLYNESYVGVDYVQQTGTRQATYGRPLTADEASNEQTTAVTAMVEQNKHAPFTERYFAIDNPNSLIGNIAAKTPSSLGNVSSSAQSGLAFVGSLLSSPQLLMQHLGSLFMPRAAAADPMITGASYGVDEWGWTAKENAKIASDPSYSPIPDPNDPNGDSPLEKYVAPHLDDWDTKYGDCYTYVQQDERPKGNCVKDCDQTDLECLSTDEALHWRFYKALGCSADSLKPNEATGPCSFTKSGQVAATGTTAGADIDMAHLHDCSSSVDCKTPVECAEGTEELGDVTGKNAAYYKGNPVNIKLCRIKGFKCTCAGAMKDYTDGKIDSHGDVAVNSRASGAWLALYNAAKDAKHNLSANSAFRTKAYQTSLCHGGVPSGCDGRTVARVGYSNHQMGLAIDIAIPGAPLSTSNCVQRGGICTPNADPSNTWHWLHDNSKKYNLQQYSVEFWHFSPDGH